MSCILGVAAFLVAPAVNFYFLTNDHTESFTYGAVLLLYIVNIFVAATWITTNLDTFRIIGVVLIFIQAAIMSRLWINHYSGIGEKNDILYLLYLISTLLHFIGFIVINPKKLKDRPKNTPTEKEEKEAAPPLKKPLLP